MKINDTNDVLVWLRTINECRWTQAQLSCALSTGSPVSFPAITDTTANNQRKEQHENKPN